MVTDKLIVLEGADGAGKKTQMGFLVRSLTGTCQVSTFDFPRYDSPTGRIIGRALKGVYGDFRHLHPHLASALYTVDRAAAMSRLRAALSKGIVVCNRYVPSNVAYQSAKLAYEERKQFVRELEEIEYEDIGLPRPNLVLYLDVPVQVSSGLTEGRGEKDQHESDLEYQELVAQVYRDLARERESWVVVQCFENGELLSPETIHEKVVYVVMQRLSLW